MAKKTIEPCKGLAHYGKRTVRVRGAARNGRSMIEWVDELGVKQKSAVKWKNLRPLAPQLFDDSPE
jgi:hypothetical protein